MNYLNTDNYVSYNNTISIQTRYGLIVLKLIEVIDYDNYTFSGKSITPLITIEGVDFTDFSYRFVMKDGLPEKSISKTKSSQESPNLTKKQEARATEEFNQNVSWAIAHNLCMVSIVDSLQEALHSLK